MKIKIVKQRATYNLSHVGKGKSASNKIEESPICILNKWSEPRALLQAWLKLDASDQGGGVGGSVIQPLLAGKDFQLDALRRFINHCAEVGIAIVVESKRGVRAFKIEADGTAYTPKSNDCPIKRRPDEPVEDFFARWNMHRKGIFSLIVHDFFKSHGVTPDEYSNSLAQVTDDRFEHLMSLLLTTGINDRDTAYALAHTAEAGIDVEPDHGQAPAISTIGNERLAEIEAKFVARLSAIEARVTALEDRIALSNPSPGLTTPRIPFALIQGAKSEAA